MTPAVAPFQLADPATGASLEVTPDGSLRSTTDSYRCDAGIWDFVRPARRARIDAFAAAYAEVRAAEGRTPVSAAAVRALPYEDLSGRNGAMWEQRAASFDRLCAEIGDGAGRTVLDVGAGSGWLAARLDGLGWKAAALDITIDGDGLAAAQHHEADLLLLRAEMDALPIANSSVDLVVFNASLHYAESVGGTLAEALRVLRPDGRLAVLDSPVFRDPEAGEAMVAEFAANAASSGIEAADHFGTGFVTEDDLATVARGVASAWKRTSEHRHVIAPVRRWLGARRAGREVAQRPLLTLTAPRSAAS